MSRKRMRNVIYSRKKLKDKDLKNHGIPGQLFIAESMAPTYKNLDWKCRQLKKDGAIKQCWFSMEATIFNCLMMKRKRFTTLPT